MNSTEVKALRPEFSPRSIVRALWNHKLLILTLWLSGTIATMAVVFTLQPWYRADALILVESQKIPEAFVTATVQTALEARLDTLKQQVLSGERLWQLIEEQNLYARQRRTRTRKEVLEIMRKDTTIGLERGWSADRAGAFRVEYEAGDPHVAAEVTNRIGRFFIDEDLRKREAEAMGTSQFLSSQLAESERILRLQEAKLRDFKLVHNGELPEQENALLASMGQSKAELLGLQDAIARAQQNKIILQNALAAAEDNLRVRQALVRQRAEDERLRAAQVAQLAEPVGPSELERARAKLKASRARYADKHPLVQALLAEIKVLEEQENALQHAGGAAPAAPKPSPREGPADESLLTERERIAGLGVQLTQMAKEIEDLEARRRRLLEDVAAIEARIQKLPIREQELAAVTRDYETCKANYKSLLDKKLAADVAANMERRQKAEKFVMLDAARVPEKPVRPKRLLLSAAGTLFCLLAAGGLSFLLELKRNVVLGEWELAPDVVVLCRLPRMKLSPM